ncbi:ribosome biogenesis protein WDR12 homolog [Striga asiatica]|uniref:Ribosome biogenesis protein WDR12 homolog n=1 Tax=Striga asiatica TaxID=4170 RepID=A0A5A7PDM0_STRAF|nr:ribosome biogenesis protein WDR12 homolog [Striga asiatica]
MIQTRGNQVPSFGKTQQSLVESIRVNRKILAPCEHQNLKAAQTLAPHDTHVVTDLSLTASPTSRLHHDDRVSAEPDRCTALTLNELSDTSSSSVAILDLPSEPLAETLAFELLDEPGANEDWESEPFDFLIDGELVRMSLEEFLLAKGISAEKVLEIEYFKAVAPRKEDEPSLHDDWVSAVDGSNDGYILTGSYDGFVRIWRAAGVCTHELDGHSGPVTSVCNVTPKDNFFSTAVSGTDRIVASASKDRTLRLWNFAAEESLDQPKKIRAFKILRGHTAAVQTIAAEPSGDMVCSGSWDCTVNLWNVNASESNGGSVSVKKRKTNGEDEELQSEGEAITTLVGHTQCVSSVVWPERGTIYSASWDHSIRKWDAEIGKDSLSMFCGKVISCLDIGGESSALVAAGGSDPVIRIWDPRKPGTLSPIFHFSSHNSWISSCKWHPKSWFHLVSASYDGKVMLWDLRTAWPLAVIDTHKDKVFSADWWRHDSVISGGADSKLRISSGISVM